MSIRLDELAADPSRALTLPADQALEALAAIMAMQPALILAAARRTTTDDVEDVDVGVREAARRLWYLPGVAVPPSFRPTLRPSSGPPRRFQSACA